MKPQETHRLNMMKLGKNYCLVNTGFVTTVLAKGLLYRIEKTHNNNNQINRVPASIISMMKDTQTNGF